VYSLYMVSARRVLCSASLATLTWHFRRISTPWNWRSLLESWLYQRPPSQLLWSTKIKSWATSHLVTRRQTRQRPIQGLILGSGRHGGAKVQKVHTFGTKLAKHCSVKQKETTAISPFALPLDPPLERGHDKIG